MTSPGPAGLKSWLCTCSTELGDLTPTTSDSCYAFKLGCMLTYMYNTRQVWTLCLHQGIDTCTPQHASFCYRMDFVLSLLVSDAPVKAMFDH